MTTNPERAEKIVDGWKCIHGDEERLASISFVTAQLDEACAEAVAEWGRLFQENVDRFPQEIIDARAEGWNAAREKAKGIAESDIHEKRLCQPTYTGHDDRWCQVCESAKDEAETLAQRIAKMEPEK